jgi:chemotaxis protein histidine kinase CheA
MADRLAALGGRLEVWSAPGQGTTITASLPLSAASGPTKPARARMSSI